MNREDSKMSGVNYIFDSKQDAVYVYASLVIGLKYEFEKFFPPIMIEQSRNSIFISSASEDNLNHGIRIFEERFKEKFGKNN